MLEEDICTCELSSKRLLYYCNYTYRYLDDIPHIQGELYAGLVLSSHTHANITVDYSEAVKMEGVKGYVGVEDVPGSNITGEYHK